MTETASGDPAALVDIGANLTHESFADDLDQVLQRAAAGGVRELVITGASVPESRLAAQLAERLGLYSTAGVHPHHAGAWVEAQDDELRALLASPRVVAVGETGLDFLRDLSPRKTQERVFERQLQLAAETGLPLFLHERDAHERFHAMLRSHRDQLGELVVHCFTGDRSALFRYLDLDCHIGITGWICDERRGAHLKELVAAIPADRLLLETDAPWLLPRDLPRPARPPGRRNEPGLLPHIARVVAEHRKEPFSRLAAATTENARRFFRLPAAQSEAPVRAVLYGTDGCHLCEEAEALLGGFLSREELLLRDIATEAVLMASYRLRIPVLRRLRDGRELDWPFDGDLLGDFLARDASR